MFPGNEKGIPNGLEITNPFSDEACHTFFHFKQNGFSMKKKESHIILLSLMLFFIVMAPSDSFGGPWQWQATLQVDIDALPMDMPTSLFIDHDKERYYVVDAGNNRLLSFDRAGKFLTAFTAGNGLQTPFDMLRTDEEALWVVEKSRNSLTRVVLKSKEVLPHTIKHKGKTIYLDRIENEGASLYVLDKASGSILALDNELGVKKIFACSECNGGFVDFKVHDGKIWALEQLEKAVYQFGDDGRQEQKILLKDVQFPCSLALGPAGLLYILDRHEGSIVVFDKSGQFKYRFLTLGHTRGQLYYPIELKFDPWGQLCVLEEGNGRVQIFSR